MYRGKKYNFNGWKSERERERAAVGVESEIFGRKEMGQLDEFSLYSGHRVKKLKKQGQNVLDGWREARKEREKRGES